MDKDKSIVNWQVIILGLMLCGGTGLLDEIFDKQQYLANLEEYERMKG